MSFQYGATSPTRLREDFETCPSPLISAHKRRDHHQHRRRRCCRKPCRRHNRHRHPPQRLISPRYSIPALESSLRHSRSYCTTTTTNITMSHTPAPLIVSAPPQHTTRTSSKTAGLIDYLPLRGTSACGARPFTSIAIDRNDSELLLGVFFENERYSG